MHQIGDIVGLRDLKELRFRIVDFEGEKVILETLPPGPGIGVTQFEAFEKDLVWYGKDELDEE